MHAAAIFAPRDMTFVVVFRLFKPLVCLERIESEKLCNKNYASKIMVEIC